MGLTSFTLMAILYAITTISYFRKRDYAMAFVFLCYGLSVLGFIWKELFDEAK